MQIFSTSQFIDQLRELKRLAKPILFVYERLVGIRDLMSMGLNVQRWHLNLLLLAENPRSMRSVPINIDVLLRRTCWNIIVEEAANH